MKKTKLKALICGILLGAFLFGSVTQASAMALNYFERGMKSYWGPWVYARWESKLAMYRQGSNVMGWSESFSWFKYPHEVSNPHGWKYYRIHYIYTWHRLVSPSGRQTTNRDTNAENRGTYVYFPRRNYVSAKTYLPYQRGRWSSVSVHRYQNEAGGLYHYKVLRDAYNF